LGTTTSGFSIFSSVWHLTQPDSLPEAVKTAKITNKSIRHAIFIDFRQSLFLCVFPEICSINSLYHPKQDYEEKNQKKGGS
jgi:hypothetical protein